MLIWIETQSEELLSLEGMRKIYVHITRLNPKGHIVYDGKNKETRDVYDVKVEFQAEQGVLDEARIARYDSAAAANTYKRFIGMTMTRAGMKRETSCIIPAVTEENLIELEKRFASYDAETMPEPPAKNPPKQPGEPIGAPPAETPADAPESAEWTPNLSS